MRYHSIPTKLHLSFTRKDYQNFTNIWRSIWIQPDSASYCEQTCKTSFLEWATRMLDMLERAPRMLKGALWTFDLLFRFCGFFLGQALDNQTRTSILSFRNIPNILKISYIKLRISKWESLNWHWHWDNVIF